MAIRRGGLGFECVEEADAVVALVETAPDVGGYERGQELVVVRHGVSSVQVRETGRCRRRGEGKWEGCVVLAVSTKRARDTALQLGWVAWAYLASSHTNGSPVLWNKGLHSAVHVS